MNHQHLNDRQRKLVVQFVKYWLGGGLEFWTGYGIFALLYSVFGLWWLWGKLAADIIGWTLNYFVQRYWAFANPKLKLNEMQHVRRYIFIESVGFVMDYGIIGGLRSIGITPYIGFFISSAFFTVWSYLWYRFWVFPETKGKVVHEESLDQPGSIPG
jgi:putative flippase GtrA